jgi:tRNA 2-thiocytidine biosynthesis protein TtcA
LGAPVIPCGCSQKTGTVRRTLRDMFAGIEKDYPYLKENLLSAMSNLEPQRLLDTRYLDLEAGDDAPSRADILPVLTEP